MFERARDLAEATGQVLDSNPEVRGWAALVGAVIILFGGVRAWSQRKGERATVRIDAPAGERVRVEVGRRRDGNTDGGAR